MIAQKDGPLAIIGNVRRLLQNLDNGMAFLLSHSHEDARHEWKVEGHVTFVAVAEVLVRILGPLVGLGK